MYPQYAHRKYQNDRLIGYVMFVRIVGQTGGEIAIWLLITVGALLIPIIVIAICCIRRQ